MISSSIKSVCCIPNDKCYHSGKRKYQCRRLRGLHQQKQCDDDTNSNDDNSCAVVVRTGPHGLHVYASRNIKAGSVIIQCLPLAHSILVPPGTSPLDECDNNDDGRRRCTRCFFSEGDTDASGWRRKKFGRCSKCRVTYYCSRFCQAEDWNEQHKLECKYYVNLRKRRSTDYSANSAEEDAVPLILRTFNKLKFMRDHDENEDLAQVTKELSELETFQHQDTLVTCGPEHFAIMTSSTSISNINESFISPKMTLAIDLIGSHAIRGRIDQSTTAALTIWGYNREHEDGDTNCQGYLILHAIRRTLIAFQKNNFGIANSLHSAVGEGVYPCAALLNHSCDPNCILRYEFGVPVVNDCGDEEEGLFHSPILQIIACKDIIAGEELCHSYVDLALTTKARQSRLFETHGFICDCKRCVVGGCSIDLPTNRGDWDLWPLRNGLRTNGEDAFVDDSECPPLINIPLDDAMIAINGYSESEVHTLNHQTDVLRHKARQSMIGDDTAGELQHLKDAIEIYSNKRNDRKWLSPFLFELYSLRCECLSALLANGRILDALEQCEHIVSFLVVAFSHVGCHPLLGLQLFTLGDLYLGVSLSDERNSVEDVECHKKKAKAAFLWAKKVMIVTHGESDRMVKTLHDYLAIL